MEMTAGFWYLGRGMLQRRGKGWTGFWDLGTGMLQGRGKGWAGFWDLGRGMLQGGGGGEMGWILGLGRGAGGSFFWVSLHKCAAFVLSLWQTNASTAPEHWSERGAVSASNSQAWV